MLTFIVLLALVAVALAAVSDRLIPSASTFNALTEDYTHGFLTDNLWLDTPLLQAFKKRMKWIEGRSEQPLIRYKKPATGGWYGRGEVVPDSVLQQLSDDIATRCKYELKRWRIPIVLDAWDTDAQGSRAIIKLFNEYVTSGVETAREDFAYDLFNGDPDTDPDMITGLNISLDDTETIGNLDPTESGFEFWRPHYMEGTSTFAAPVAPSLENHRLMIRKIKNTLRRKPQVIVVAEDLWDVLAAQVDVNDNAVSRRKTDDLFDWGFIDLSISGVPVLEDLNMLGEAWVGGQSTRAAAKGYQSFFINFDELYLSANQKRSFKWDPAGWRRPTNMDGQLNYFYIWAQMVQKNRRAQGRIWNQDLDLDYDSWKSGTVTRPEAA